MPPFLRSTRSSLAISPVDTAQMSRGTHSNESRHTFQWATSHIWIYMGNAPLSEVHPKFCHGTHSNESRHTFEYLWAMCSVLMVSGTLPPFWGPPEGLWQSFWLTRIVVSFVFCVVMCLFWWVIGLFWQVIGLSWRVSQYLGHLFVGPTRNILSMYCNKSVHVYKWIYKTPKTGEKKSPSAYFKKSLIYCEKRLLSQYIGLFSQDFRLVYCEKRLLSQYIRLFSQDMSLIYCDKKLLSSW